MEFLRKMAAKHDDKYGKPPVTLAFLGDSVTQGCFEVYETGGGGLDTVYDPENNYAHKTASVVRQMCPGWPGARPSQRGKRTAWGLRPQG